MLTPNPLSLSAIAEAIRHQVLTRPVLAISGAGAATVSTTNAIVYTIDGRIYNKAALSAQSIATIATGAPAEYLQPASTTVYYALCLDSSGNVRFVQGTYAGQTFLTAGRVDKGLGGVPDIPDGYCPFGLIKVVTNASTTFNIGTTLLDAAGLTVTFIDISQLPKTAP